MIFNYVAQKIEQEFEYKAIKQTNGTLLLTRIALWILYISKFNNKLGKQLNKFAIHRMF